MEATSQISKEVMELPGKPKNKCRVDIYGRSYIIRSDTEPSYAQELAAMVDSQMRKLAANGKGVDLSKLAVFTAINMAHELYSLKKQLQENEAVINRKTNELIEYIEDQLDRFC